MCRAAWNGGPHYSTVTVAVCPLLNAGCRAGLWPCSLHLDRSSSRRRRSPLPSCCGTGTTQSNAVAAFSSSTAF
jgi:hypothetical protein